MKNLNLLFLVILSLSSYTLQAQFSIGIKGGYTLAWPDYGTVVLPDNAQTAVNGLNGGLILAYRIGKKISVNIEPGYVQRGAACEPGWQPIFAGDSRLLMDYVEFPVMFSLHQPIFRNKMNVNLKAGYGFSRIVSAYREEFFINSSETVSRTKLDLNDPLSTSLVKTDHGIYGGVSIGYNLSTGTVFLESTYYHGLKNVDRENFIKNNSVNFNAGYMFTLNCKKK